MTEPLRLSMKVYTDTDGRRYLVALGQYNPPTDQMFAYAMRDDVTTLLAFTGAEWNALPFFYFREDGPAPRRATKWPVP